MKEIDTSSAPVKGHLRLGWDDLRRDIYRLFTHFHGSGALADVSNTDTGIYYANLQQRFEELEIQDLLLRLAVRIRILEDAYRETWQEPWSKSVGRLFNHSTKPEHTALSVREACNKVIHARYVNFCRTGVAEENEVIFPLLPTVVLYGTLIRSPIFWKCELQVNDFLDSALTIAEYVYGPLMAKSDEAPTI
jgi:hypothetical protein